jgi:hypothetical protein
VQLRTLALYLIGDREAILSLAADRRALWVGLVLVLSAGFAREYDGEDLLREPWYLVIPVGASLGASFLLFLVACGSMFYQTGARPPFFRAYRSFLTLFWLTAPLAWLYAIPYERFLSPGDATRANLWTLAFVAAWRVVLMVRVVSVITGRGWWPALCLVMVFADGAALLAVFSMPRPVMSFMGGVRLSETEAVVRAATSLVCCFGCSTAPLWFIGASYASGTRVRWQVPVAVSDPAPVSRGVRIVVTLSLLVWVPILPFTQREQHLRGQVERDLRVGRIAEALDVMSAHERCDFPPGWEPPPRISSGETSPHIFDVMDVLLVRDVAPWVRAEFLEKFQRFPEAVEGHIYPPLRSERLPQLVRILSRLPEGPGLAKEFSGLNWRYGEQLSEEEEASRLALERMARGEPAKR